MGSRINYLSKNFCVKHFICLNDVKSSEGWAWVSFCLCTTIYQAKNVNIYHKQWNCESEENGKKSVYIGYRGALGLIKHQSITSATKAHKELWLTKPSVGTSIYIYIYSTLWVGFIHIQHNTMTFFSWMNRMKALKKSLCCKSGFNK